MINIFGLAKIVHRNECGSGKKGKRGETTRRNQRRNIKLPCFMYNVISQKALISEFPPFKHRNYSHISNQSIKFGNSDINTF